MLHLHTGPACIGNGKPDASIQQSRQPGYFPAAAAVLPPPVAATADPAPPARKLAGIGGSACCLACNQAAQTIMAEQAGNSTEADPDPNPDPEPSPSRKP
jgi:hypothetical protein